MPACSASRRCWRCGNCCAPRWVGDSHVSTTLQAALIVILVTSFLLLPAILSRAGATQAWHGCSRRSGSSACRKHSSANWSPACSAACCRLALRLRKIWRLRGIARSRPGCDHSPGARWRPDHSLVVAVTASFLELPFAAAATGRSSRRSLSRTSPAHASNDVLRSGPRQRERILFTVHCLFRSGPHRVVMAGCAAVALALSTVLLGAGASPAAGLSEIRVRVRHADHLPGGDAFRLRPRDAPAGGRCREPAVPDRLDRRGLAS